MWFVVRHYFAVSGDTIETAGYHYAFETPEGKELLVYHWHPGTPTPIPHLHLGSGALVGRPELAKAHIPTGEVRWPEVLWLVRELVGTAPRS